MIAMPEMALRTSVGEIRLNQYVWDLFQHYHDQSPNEEDEQVSYGASGERKCPSTRLASGCFRCSPNSANLMKLTSAIYRRFTSPTLEARCRTLSWSSPSYSHHQFHYNVILRIRFGFPSDCFITVACYLYCQVINRHRWLTVVCILNW
jgi:hypothetical protein